MIRFYLVFAIIIILYGHNYAQIQPDTTEQKYELKPVDINGDRMQFSPDINIQKFDQKVLKARSSDGLQTLLSDYANVNIRSYGYTGLSNVSMRGANSNHTAILWNGFNLQDPLNGGANLLLFPLFFVDQVQVQKGGSSALFGSGAMGGVISLENQLNFNQGLALGVFGSVASYENTQIGASAQYSAKNAVFLIKAYHKQGKNDFPFTNTQQFGNPEVRQQNAALEQWGLLQENAFRLGKKQILNTHFWYQSTDHQLPPNMAQENSEKSQYDESVRGSIDWNYYTSKWRLTIRNGTFYNKLKYADPETGIYTQHHSLRNISEGEGNIKIRKEKDLLNAGINYTYEEGFSDSYTNSFTRNRLSAFASYKMQISKRISLTGSGRKEYVDDRFTPFTFSVKGSLKEVGAFRFFVQYAQNYRIPTFNDLYWYDGMARGNPDLEDESSWNMEVGAGFLKSMGKSELGIKASGFNSYFTNLIQWVPVQGIYMPMNQKEVWSRGAEVRINYAYNAKKWSIKGGVSYSYIHSTLEKKAEDEPESVLGKQLILTPMNQGSFNVKFQYRSWGMTYIQELVGKQYITLDHTDWIYGYTLGNLIFTFDNSLFKQPVSLLFRWNNIWNTVYQTMPAYAMPRANFELSFQYHFNNPKS